MRSGPTFFRPVRLLWLDRALFFAYNLNMPKRSHPMDLTANERRFAKNLVKGMGKAEAYVAAYNPKIQTLSAVASNASHVLKRPCVQAYLRKLYKKAEKAAVMDRAEALKVLSNIGRAKLIDYIDEDGNIRGEVLEQSAQDLQKLKVRKSETHHDNGSVTYTKESEIQLRDPVKAIERIAKMQDWDADKGIQLDNISFHLDLGLDDDGTEGEAT